MKQALHKGKVIFAGAGPGDPELLTLKAARFLQKADVVITDRLVSEQILEEFVGKDALVLHAGKQRNSEGSTPQEVINELLIEYASAGNLVVRLKGGDVSFFSNILDELKALVENKIEYEIIPGVTAASGAAAAAGIPLTARDHANAVRFLTLYKNDLLEEKDWAGLASTDDTLVFYMSSGNLDDLVDSLLIHGIGEEKFISVIEQATTPMQHVSTAPVHEYAHKIKGRNWISPTLVIIGKVARLQQQFEWIPNAHIEASYFRPIEKPNKSKARA
jgi:uroporphyrin-III C-methyltransferase